jgi:hypothetical protein
MPDVNMEDQTTTEARVTTTTTTMLSPSLAHTTTTAPTSSLEVTVPHTTGRLALSLEGTDNLCVQSPQVRMLVATPALVTEGSTITRAEAESTFSGSTTQYDFWLVPPAKEMSGTDRLHRCFTTFSSAAVSGKRRAAFTEEKGER